MELRATNFSSVEEFLLANNSAEVDESIRTFDGKLSKPIWLHKEMYKNPSDLILKRETSALTNLRWFLSEMFLHHVANTENSKH